MGTERSISPRGAARRDLLHVDLAAEHDAKVLLLAVSAQADLVLLLLLSLDSGAIVLKRKEERVEEGGGRGQAGEGKSVS